MFSDAQITAYLDGELPADETAAINAALADDADLAARLVALDLDRSALIAAFEPLLDLAPAMRPAPKPRYAAYALAASVLLAIGIGLGSRMKPVELSWQQEVAHYQALYVADTLGSIKRNEALLASQLKAAGDRLGLHLDRGALDTFDGLTLRRAQVLGFNGQVLVQVAYTMADGTPVAFCILKRQTGTDIPVAVETHVGLAMATWQNDNHGFLTIGGQDEGVMQRFATHLSALF